MVERRSRIIRLVHMSASDSTSVCRAYAEKLAAEPPGLRLTVSCDRGSEMTEHGLLASMAGVAVYFCAAHHPWEKGAVENRNSEIRRFLPKGTDLSDATPERLAWIEETINAKPLEILGWRSPADVWAEAVRQVPPPCPAETAGAGAGAVLALPESPNDITSTTSNAETAPAAPRP